MFYCFCNSAICTVVAWDGIDVIIIGGRVMGVAKSMLRAGDSTYIMYMYMYNHNYKKILSVIYNNCYPI